MTPSQEGREGIDEHFHTGLLVVAALLTAYGNRILVGVMATAVGFHAYHNPHIYQEMLVVLLPWVAVGALLALSVPVSLVVVGYLTNQFAPDLPTELVR